VNLDRSEGRFILKQNDFLDPVIYAQGREITVVGEVVGKEDLPLGKIRYDYPVVMAEHCVLWEKPGYYYPSSYPYHYYYGPYWDYNPLWAHYPLRGYYRMHR
jgi:outer membrane lipoprotein